MDLDLDRSRDLEILLSDKSAGMRKPKGEL